VPGDGCAGSIGTVLTASIVRESSKPTLIVQGTQLGAGEPGKASLFGEGFGLFKGQATIVQTQCQQRLVLPDRGEIPTRGVVL